MAPYQLGLVRALTTWLCGGMDGWAFSFLAQS